MPSRRNRTGKIVDSRSADAGKNRSWSVPLEELLRGLGTDSSGLSDQEAARRLESSASLQLQTRRRRSDWQLLVSQFSSPIILLLIAASLLSLFLHDPTDSLIILVIVLASGVLGFWQERGANRSVEALLSMVQTTIRVLRSGRAKDIPSEHTVKGDVLNLSAGDTIPGDCRVLSTNNLYVDEAALTGETFPVAKSPGTLAPDTPIGQRSNSLYMGTHVVSGSASALVVRIGRETEYGRISDRLKFRPPETEFERGVRRFGFLLLEITLIMLILIFAFNIFLKRHFLDSALFALALAVGLTPQLLPAIISINLAKGAERMARKKVIVKRLESIENFGSMNILCTDKTGTLTEGVVRIHSAIDIHGEPSEKVLFHAFINASFESGFRSPIDEAVRSFKDFELGGYEKLDELPYDFARKRLSVLVATNGRRLLVSKGAFDRILEICTRVEHADGKRTQIGELRSELEQRFQVLSGQGFRVLGVAIRELGSEAPMGPELEAEMTLLGLLVLHDPPKPEILETLRETNRLGIAVKMITGDNRLVAASVGRQIDLRKAQVLTGQQLRRMSDEALLRRAAETDIFAEVEPNQKERIILALKKAGNVVGYLGDGINDATALHAADVGISVEGGADVAKNSADIVLLERNLEVLVQGVLEGRRTFANTLKYVFMASSANFGNMLSMAAGSLFLPFLPLLPKQILLTNLITDFPEMTIATDNVDAEMLTAPRRWEVKTIRRFMLVFGPLSSVFDFLTFAALLILLRASPEQFRTGWFLESIASATLIVLVIRSRASLLSPGRGRGPSRYLLGTILLAIAATFALPYTPLAGILGFTALPLRYLAVLIGIVVPNLAAAQGLKRLFYRRIGEKA
jgi:Mg2+-importing ATPase